MNKQQSWSTGKMIYTLLMAFLLLGYLAVIATYSDPTTTGRTFSFPGFIWILRVATGIMALFLGKLWKDSGFRILAAMLLLKLIRVIADGGNYVFDEAVSESLITGFWAFSACYGLSRILNREQLKRFVDIGVLVWTVGMMVFSCIAIYAAWKGENIYTIGEGAIWGVQKNRLFLVYFPTVSGSVLSLTTILSLCGAIAAKHKFIRILYLLAIIPVMIALSLTDSRCAQVTVSAGIALMIGICILRKMREKGRSKAKKSWYAWTVAIVMSVFSFVVIILLCMKTITVFNHVRANGLLIPKALAEGTEIKAIVSNRGYTGDNILTSRPMIWRAAIEVIIQNPLYLIWGTSVRNPMTLVNISKIMTFRANHCHCMPLMILLENGIPGLLLAGAFFMKIMAASIRLVLKADNKRDILPVPFVASILLGELIECFLWLRTGQCPTLPFFFVAAGIILTTGQKEKPDHALAA